MCRRRRRFLKFRPASRAPYIGMRLGDWRDSKTTQRNSGGVTFLKMFIVSCYLRFITPARSILLDYTTIRDSYIYEMVGTYTVCQNIKMY